jgi:DNA helicase IV
MNDINLEEVTDRIRETNLNSGVNSKRKNILKQNHLEDIQDRNEELPEEFKRSYLSEKSKSKVILKFSRC